MSPGRADRTRKCAGARRWRPVPGHSRLGVALLGMVAAIGCLLVEGAGTSASPPSPDPLGAIRPGEWYEVPDSHMRNVCPAESRAQCGAVMGAWSGAAYDTRRDRLIVWGGGHADYWGNEVYAFDVKMLQWTRLNEPYLPARELKNAETVSAYPDGSPASRHTYDGLEYLPEQDRVWAVGGSRWRSGTGDAYTAVFDFEAIRWERRSDAPRRVLTPASAWDPVARRVLLYSRGRLFEYDPAGDRWSTRGEQGGADDALVGEVDVNRRRFVLVGHRRAFFYDLTPAARLTREPLEAADGDEIESARAPGLAYSPRLKRIVAWAGGPDVYLLEFEPTTRWVRVRPAPSNQVMPTASARTGTYGRWRYIPSRDLFIGVNGVNQNVFLYRPAFPPGALPAPG